MQYDGTWNIKVGKAQAKNDTHYDDRWIGIDDISASSGSSDWLCESSHGETLIHKIGNRDCDIQESTVPTLDENSNQIMVQRLNYISLPPGGALILSQLISSSPVIFRITGPRCDDGFGNSGPGVITGLLIPTD
jgi:hypothetical protein